MQDVTQILAVYFKALEAADAAYRGGEIDVLEMETALKGMLARQLLSVIEDADGGVAVR